ncbi:MAG: N-acetyl-gamma-glutamyl-phosphate reductase [Pseudomonadales bacterium]
MTADTRPHIFIDGQAGTTGLQIAERLRARDDLQLLEIDAAARKFDQARAELMAQSDVTILCLPDAAVAGAVTLAAGQCRLLDASSVHRTAPGWVYGLPELGAEQRRQIAAATQVSNPGCYPQGPILMLRPLIDAGWLDPKTPRSIHSVSGYSGGGRGMIDAYRSFDSAEAERFAARSYALGLNHKHLPEMQRYAGLEQAPLFAPAVGNYYQGMLTHVPVFTSELQGQQSRKDVERLLAQRYQDDPCVRVIAIDEQDPCIEGYLDAGACNQTNDIELMVFGNADQLLLIARYDNLGKGAAGCAVQNLNLMLGKAETTGLQLGAAAQSARAATQ